MIDATAAEVAGWGCPENYICVLCLFLHFSVGKQWIEWCQRLQKPVVPQVTEPQVTSCVWWCGCWFSISCVCKLCKGVMIRRSYFCPNRKSDSYRFIIMRMEPCFDEKEIYLRETDRRTAYNIILIIYFSDSIWSCIHVISVSFCTLQQLIKWYAAKDKSLNFMSKERTYRLTL